MRRNWVAWLLVGTIMTSACNNEYVVSSYQFSQIAAGPPPVPVYEGPKRRLLIRPDMAIPVMRAGSLAPARVCAKALEIEDAQLRSETDGKVWLTTPAPRKLLVPGGIMLGLGVVFSSLAVYSFARPAKNGSDDLGNGIGGILALFAGISLLGTGLGLTIAGGVKQSPESCTVPYEFPLQKD